MGTSRVSAWRSYSRDRSVLREQLPKDLWRRILRYGKPFKPLVVLFLITLIIGSLLTVAFGFYRVGQCNLERNAAKKEKREARMAIVPYLQAEEDARAVAAKLNQDADEAEIMKGVKDWKVGASVYNSERFWAPPSPVEHPRA